MKKLLSIDGGAFCVCDSSYRGETNAATIAQAIEVGKGDAPMPRYDIPCVVKRTGGDGGFEIEIIRFDFDIKKTLRASQIGEYKDKQVGFASPAKATLNVESGGILITSLTDEFVYDIPDGKYRVEIFSLKVRTKSIPAPDFRVLISPVRR